MVRSLGLLVAFLFSLATLAPVAARAADDSKVKEGTRQVESGARKIGDGKVGEGVEETAKGIGKTVAEGAKYTGDKLKESGKAAEPQARSAWGNLRDGAVDFGHSVKRFFGRLVGTE
jgi:hypothetical protein